jgi:hypothetical protein
MLETPKTGTNDFQVMCTLACQAAEDINTFSPVPSLLITCIFIDEGVPIYTACLSQLS